MTDSDSRIISGDNIFKHHFTEKYEIYDECNNTHVANIYYAPTKNRGAHTRVLRTIHGYDGAVDEFALRALMENGLDMGYDVLGIESLVMSITNPAVVPIEQKTLSNHRNALYWSMKYSVRDATIKKNLGKSVLNVTAAHSMGARGLTDCVFSAASVRYATDVYMLLQMYLLTAPGVVNSVMECTANGTLERVSRFAKKSERTINGQKFQGNSKMPNFIIDLPIEWQEAFDDYIGFMKRVASIAQLDTYEEYCALPENQKVFYKNEGFIKKLIQLMPKKETHLFMGSNDIYKNYILNMALGNELKNQKPNRFNIHSIEGGDHFFENVGEEYIRESGNVLYTLKDEIRRGR